jgi:hypothetical protein
VLLQQQSNHFLCLTNDSFRKTILIINFTMKNLKYFLVAAVCGGAFVIFSAFDKVTLEEQMKAITAKVEENTAAFEATKRSECKAMAEQKAIGIAEAKWAEESKGKGGKAVVAPAVKPVTPVKQTKKTTIPVKPAPPVKPATPAPAPTPAPTTGRRSEAPATPAAKPTTTEQPTTGRRGGGK